jgi:outer membrane protein assembly factor BamB
VTRRRWLAVGAAAVLLVIAAGAAVALYRMHQGRDVRGSSTVEFVPTLPKPAPPPKKLRPVVEKIVWPAFGFDPSRLHVGWGLKVAPPYAAVWRTSGPSLVEFAPSIGFGRLFFEDGTGTVHAVTTSAGTQEWAFRAHRCAAATPALGPVLNGTVYAVFLNRPPCNASTTQDGEVVALSAKTGAVRWRRTIGPSETSPVVDGSRVLVGDWTGKIYALNARTGRTVWTYTTGGAVKGGMAVAGGRVYAGSYDGHVYALRGSDGHLLWRADADPRLFGSSTFYSTPAVAYDRVYIGGTDGKVYSFGATTGERRWSQSTGSYVYGSPAVWNRRVYVGSYDGSFYAFDAATGDQVWSFHANGPISGSANVIAGVVYFSTLKHRTYALAARTGKLLWSKPFGTYAGAVADHRCLFVVGYSAIYAFAPRSGSGSAKATCSPAPPVSGSTSRPARRRRA